MLNYIVPKYYPIWDKEAQEEFIRAATYVNVDEGEMITGTKIFQTGDNIVVFSAAGNIHPECGISLEFDARRGIGMLGGCEHHYIGGADQLVKRYHRGRDHSRPDQAEKFAFVIDAILTRKGNQMPAELLEKMREDFNTLAPEGLSEDMRARFAREIPIDFDGADL